MGAQCEDRRAMLENCTSLIGTIFRISRGGTDPLADGERIQPAFGDSPISEIYRYRDGSFSIHDVSAGICFTNVGGRVYGGIHPKPDCDFRLADRTIRLVRMRLLQRMEGLEADLAEGKLLPQIMAVSPDVIGKVFPPALR